MPQFQRVIDDIVMKEWLKETYPYLDNITIEGTSQEEHNNNVKRFLDSIAQYGMDLNQSKIVPSISEIFRIPSTNRSKVVKMRSWNVSILCKMDRQLLRQSFSLDKTLIGLPCRFLPKH